MRIYIKEGTKKDRITRKEGNTEPTPPGDRRRIVMLHIENQQVVIVCGWLMQCADSQVVRCCGKEGIKNPHRREEEFVNAFFIALMRFSLDRIKSSKTRILFREFL